MTTSIRALLFDFDGLILDTETAELGVWKSIYADYGFVYPQERYFQNIGVWGDYLFDPAGHLHELTKDSLDVEAIRLRHRDESAVIIARQPPRDGIPDYLSAARRLGLRIAVASSAPHSWVETHLTRLGLLQRFDTLVCGDDVPPGRTKPYPDIYLKALDKLGLMPAQAIAFEDSPPGVAAAHAAGVFVVAVPNPTTASLKFEGAQLVINSLSGLPLTDLLQRAAR